LKYDSWHKDALAKFGNILGNEMAQRRYAEQLSMLATDPLVRLHMSGITPGITPEMPTGPAANPFLSYPGLLGPAAAAAGFRPPMGGPLGLDPRFR